MSESYVECLVKSQSSFAAKLGKIVLIMLTAASCVMMLVFWPAVILAAAAGVGSYFAWLHTDLEFEYLYLEKELTVDKVMAKSKRKRVAVYEVDRMEILAPIRSYRLDGYKNRQVKTLDYSTRTVEQPDLRYAMYYEGNIKVILSPSPELVRAIKNIAPRKVFTD